MIYLEDNICFDFLQYLLTYLHQRDSCVHEIVFLFGRCSPCVLSYAKKLILLREMFLIHTKSLLHEVKIVIFIWQYFWNGPRENAIILFNKLQKCFPTQNSNNSDPSICIIPFSFCCYSILSISLKTQVAVTDLYFGCSHMYKRTC